MFQHKGLRYFLQLSDAEYDRFIDKIKKVGIQIDKALAKSPRSYDGLKILRRTMRFAVPRNLKPEALYLIREENVPYVETLKGDAQMAAGNVVKDPLYKLWTEQWVRVRQYA